MKAIGIKSRFGQKQDNKFTKEYKSPQESRFKMASFTDIVKSKVVATNRIPQNRKTSKVNNNSLLKPRHSYLSSTVKKPKIKAVKHEKIYLDSQEKRI